MNVLKPILMPTLVIGAFIFGAPGASATREPKVPQIQQRVTITSFGAGAVEVIVPQGVRISTRTSLHRLAGPNPDIRLKGGRDFVGIALVEQTVDGPREQFIAGRFNLCDRARCPAKQTYNYVSGSTSNWQPLAPGRYKLYLLGDQDSRLRATLRFDGAPSGALNEEAVDNASFDPGDIETAQTDPALWSSGSSFLSGEEGVAVAMLTWKARDKEHTRWGICSFPDVGNLPPQAAFGPGCTGASYLAGAGVERTTPELGDMNPHVMFLQYEYNPSGTKLREASQNQYLGAWVSSTSSIERAEFRGFFLSY